MLRSLISSILRLVGVHPRDGAAGERARLDQLEKSRAGNVDLRQRLKQDVGRYETALGDLYSRYERASHEQKLIFKDEIEETVQALRGTEQRREILSRNIKHINEAMEVLHRLTAARQGLSEESVDVLTDMLEVISGQIVDTDLAMRDLGEVRLIGQQELDRPLAATRASSGSLKAATELSEEAVGALERLKPRDREMETEE